MKIYHTATQEAYDELMVELEEKGFKWKNGENPTTPYNWFMFEEKTYVMEENKKLTCGNIKRSYINLYSEQPLIKYKAKGENMTQEEMKHNLHEVEPSLQDVKSSAKNLIKKIDDLIENIDEYLESQKPEFKVGDYVVELDKYITKITEKNDDDMFKGYFYMPGNNHFSPIKDSVSSYIARYATPEEVSEYEAALTFHEHGRKPFEVKEGDLIKYPNGQNIMIYHPDCFSKTDFLNDGFKLIKTAEEVNEWLENK